MSKIYLQNFKKAFSVTIHTSKSLSNKQNIKKKNFLLFCAILITQDAILFSVTTVNFFKNFVYISAFVGG